MPSRMDCGIIKSKKSFIEIRIPVYTEQHCLRLQTRCHQNETPKIIHWEHIRLMAKVKHSHQQEDAAGHYSDRFTNTEAAVRVAQAIDDGCRVCSMTSYRSRRRDVHWFNAIPWAGDNKPLSITYLASLIGHPEVRVERLTRRETTVLKHTRLVRLPGRSTKRSLWHIQQSILLYTRFINACNRVWWFIHFFRYRIWWYLRQPQRVNTINNWLIALNKRNLLSRSSIMCVIQGGPKIGTIYSVRLNFIWGVVGSLARALLQFFLPILTVK